MARTELTLILAAGALLVAAKPVPVPEPAARPAGVGVPASVRGGVDRWRAGDYATAVAAWKPFAEAGDADALFNLGQAYKLGRGVAADPDTARELYRQAALKQHLPAQANLGIILFQAGDKAEAFKWLRAAADRGEPRAQYVLGIALYNGDGIPRARGLAYGYLLRAASGRLPQATSALATITPRLAPEERTAGETVAASLAAGTGVPVALAARTTPRLVGGPAVAAADATLKPAPKPATPATAEVTLRPPPATTVPNRATLDETPSPAAKPAPKPASPPAARPAAPAEVAARLPDPAPRTPAPNPTPPAPRVVTPAAVAAVEPRPAPATPARPSPAPSAIAPSATIPAATTPAATASLTDPARATPAPVTTAAIPASRPPAEAVASLPVPAAAVPAATRPEPPATLAAAEPARPAAAPKPPGWRVQLGAFSARKLADAAWRSARADPVLADAKPIFDSVGPVTRLQLGPYPTRAAARAVCTRLADAGRACFVTQG